MNETVSPRRRHPIFRLSGLVFDSLFALPFGCVAGLVWANTDPETYFQFTHSLTFIVNDIGMVFFFAFIAKELVEATLPEGALHPWRRAALPVTAAIGAVVVPYVIYVAYLKQMSELMLIPGWPAAAVVDIAAAYLVARVIFGQHPAVPFLLLMAISIDAIGLGVLAMLQPIGEVHLPSGIGLMGVAIAAAAALHRRGVKNFWPYLLGPGVLSWAALYLAGVHPALALAPIIPFMPHARRDAGMFEDASPQARDTLTSFQRWWTTPVHLVLLLFGLVNAGVPIRGLEAGTWAVPLAGIIGRPIGILVAAGLALAAGLHLPPRVGWRELLVIGFTAGIGLAVALYFATAIMPIGPLLLEMKMGALLTPAAAIVAIAAAWVLGVGRFERKRV